MPTLSKELRRTLENVVAEARRIAEAGAEQALKQLAVHHSESWPAMTTEEKALREKLRAHGKQLGDKREANRTQEIPRLKQACAYEHWHRMLFARFLAENNLLIHPDYGEPLSMEEVRELAREQNADWLSIAAGYAQKMLLEVFRADDPGLQLILPPETRQQLEDKLVSLPAAIFAAEDSLGWVYQFWQRDEKDAVNKSEVKIGASQLAPVTQLFTEDYMVLFLLHNTLGAWWVSKRRAEHQEPVLPGYEWTYLRLNDDGAPVAGGYDRWPKAARDIRLLDPCMGSGHFLTFALPILARIRMTEEGITLADAVTAVLRDNLFGLELDGRCSQIAAFNLAISAWKIAGLHFPLPQLNLACSGLGINASETDWLNLSGDDEFVRQTMRKLYAVFRQAPVLGSLIDPTRLGKELFAVAFQEVSALLQQALGAEESRDDARELAIAAQGLLAAGRILADHFTLVATNVPYLGRGRQDPGLAEYCDEHYRDARADLANCFIDRSLRFCTEGGTAALVTKQELLFQGSYKDQRKRLLTSVDWDFVAVLGPRAFETLTGERVIVTLLGLSRQTPNQPHLFPGWDVSTLNSAGQKAIGLKSHPTETTEQFSHLKNPDSRVVLSTPSSLSFLGTFAESFQGIKTGDDPRMRRLFWEVERLGTRWRPFQSTVKATCLDGGRESIIDWQNNGSDCARLQGLAALGRLGVAVGQSRGLPSTLYTGELFDSNVAPVLPRNPADFAAIWAFCSSEQFAKEMQKIDPKFAVANSSVTKVPFDLTFWKKLASEDYPEGLPDRQVSDPTQWLFDGHPKMADYPLQVAVARLVGYRWPRQTGSSFTDYPALSPDGLEGHSEGDGIVCLSSVAGEAPAAERLRRLLADAYGSEWSATRLAGLLENCDSLERWLRDRFFAEHCVLFDNRPFVWHVWDGLNNGFHAFVNYHRLAASQREGRKTLEKLTYTVLGDWITRQKADAAADNEGADVRLTAAQHLQSELEKILAGDPPYDIFVRWKPIHEQPIGWEPDLNDGVRLNIRPWLNATLPPYPKPKKGACILRVTPTNLPIGTDKGREASHEDQDFPWFADSPVRNNDIHIAADDKRAARERRKQ